MTGPSAYLSVRGWSIDGEMVSPGRFIPRWTGKTRCPLRCDLRDWLHRLDAKGEMRGDQLAESLGSARPEGAGFLDSDMLCTTGRASKMLAGLEAGGWIVREKRCGVMRWVPGPNFDIKRFERWIAAGAPHDGTGNFPTSWGIEPPAGTQQSLFAESEAI